MNTNKNYAHAYLSNAMHAPNQQLVENLQIMKILMIRLLFQKRYFHMGGRS